MSSPGLANGKERISTRERKKGQENQQFALSFGTTDLDLFLLVVQTVGFLLCFLPIAFNSVANKDSYHNDHQKFQITFAVATSFSVPLLLDGLLERAVSFFTNNCPGGSSFYTTCKFKVLLGLLICIPNVIIIYHEHTPTVYLSMSQAQQLLLNLLIIRIMYDISYIRNGLIVWDTQTTAALVVTCVLASSFQLFFSMFGTNILLSLTAFSVGIYSVVLLSKSVVWFTQCFLENIQHFVESSPESYQRKAMAYDVLSVSMYLLALISYLVVNVLVCSFHPSFDLDSIKARVICSAILGVFLSMIPGIAKQLKLKAMEVSGSVRVMCVHFCIFLIF